MNDVFTVLLIAFIFLLSCGKSSENEESNGVQDERREEGSEEQNDGGMMMGRDGMMSDHMMGDGMMSEEMHKAMMSEGMGPDMMDDMRVIHKMLMQHEKITRKVQDIENGVKTWTTSEDPEIAAAIQKHVRQMKDRMESGEPIRQMDPVFREIFEHAEKIDMHVKDVDNGVIVEETSEDPQLVKLIRQHAHRAVSEFVQQGMSRAMQPTPLPEGYNE